MLGLIVDVWDDLQNQLFIPDIPGEGSGDEYVGEDDSYVGEDDSYVGGGT